MIRVLLKFLLFIVVFVVLTVLTQIGGLIFAFSVATASCFTREKSSIIVRGAIHICTFAALYVAATLYIVPLVASTFGRVPLPIDQTRNVKPVNSLTCLLNRHYVNPKLRETTFRVAEAVAERYPGSVLKYLDANFPFYDGFPLPPHLSHNDGKKLDVAFFYKNKADGSFALTHPSWLGYGFCEVPRVNEFDRSQECAEQGHWQYSLLKKFTPQKENAHFEFDAARTKRMIETFSRDKMTSKILIEPHLKTRLKLSSAKIRLHGCNSVRHDDHVHIQMD